MIKTDQVLYFAENSNHFVRWEGEGKFSLTTFGDIQDQSIVESVFQYLLSRRQGDDDYEMFTHAKLRWAASLSLEIPFYETCNLRAMCKQVWRQELLDDEKVGFALFVQKLLYDRDILSDKPESTISEIASATACEALEKDSTSSSISKLADVAELSDDIKTLTFNGSGIFQLDYQETDDVLKFSLTCSSPTDIEISVQLNPSNGKKRV